MFLLFTCKFVIVFADDVAVFCSDDQIRTFDADADLFAVAFLSDGFRIITDCILAAQFFGDAGKSRVQIICRVGFKNSAAAVSCQFFQITPTCFIFRTTRTRTSAAAARKSAAADLMSSSIIIPPKISPRIPPIPPLLPPRVAVADSESNRRRFRCSFPNKCHSESDKTARQLLRFRAPCFDNSPAAKSCQRRR